MESTQLVTLKKNSALLPQNTFTKYMNFLLHTPHDTKDDEVKSV